jgi:hypothetical protein
MKDWEPHLGDSVGVKYHSFDPIKIPASIEQIVKISPIAQQLTLSNGRRYKKTTGISYFEIRFDDIKSHICTLEEAQTLIAAWTEKQQQSLATKNHLKHKKAQIDRISHQAAAAALDIIISNGCGDDFEGYLDVLNEEIKTLVSRYLESKLST